MLLGDRDVEVAIGKALREFNESGALRIAGFTPMMVGSRAPCHTPLPEDLRVGRPVAFSLKMVPLRGSNGPRPCH